MIILYTQDNEPFAVGTDEYHAIISASTKQQAIVRQNVKAVRHDDNVQLTWKDGELWLTIRKMEMD